MLFIFGMLPSVDLTKEKIFLTLHEIEVRQSLPLVIIHSTRFTRLIHLYLNSVLNIYTPIILTNPTSTCSKYIASGRFLITTSVLFVHFRYYILR